MQRRTTILISTLVLGGLLAAGAVAGTSALGADAQGPPTGTLVFDFEDPSAAGFGANTARGGKLAGVPRKGDIVTVRGPITIDGKRAGTEYATLTFQGGPPAFQAVFAFDDGSKLVAAGVTAPEGPSVNAIIGGSGRFAGARGDITETVLDAKTQSYRETVRFIP